MLVEWVSGSSVVDKLDELADESIGLDVGLVGIIALKVQQHLGPVKFQHFQNDDEYWHLPFHFD